MNIQIRKATVEDAAALCVIGVKTFYDTWHPFSTPENLQLYLDTAYSLNSLRDELMNPTITYFVAMNDDEMVGFAKLTRQQELGDWITDKCIEVCRIYVLQEYHDKKVGKLLMEESIKLAEEEKMESVVLGVWENNHRALAFYKKWGFEVIGSHPFVLGSQVDTDLVMRRIV